MISLTMEKTQPKKWPGRRKAQMRADRRTKMPDTVDVKNKSTIFSQRILFYVLLFLKVGLWIALAWVLSSLHMGAPCFVLALLVWMYSGPMQAALNWTKKRLMG